MGGSAGIGEMIELEMSDSKAAKAAAQKAAKGNPTTISTRVRTLNGERLKVNDKMGNPIEIATVVVWHGADTAKTLVEGAVSLIDMAVQEMAAGGTIALDDERKAQMASNLMVVLCGESEAHPVLNAGSLY